MATTTRTCCLLLVALLPLGCGDFSGEQRPVADSTMVEVFVELHLASTRQTLSYGTLPAASDTIFARYGIDHADFMDMAEYYTQHPDAYAAIYTLVVDKISEERYQQGGDLITIPPGVDDTRAGYP